MQTRQSPRRRLNLPGRYFTGQGEPVTVVLRDVSDGGCRFPAGPLRPIIGSPIQIYVGPTGPHRATIRWVEDGDVGVTFERKLSKATVDQFQSSHIPDDSVKVEDEQFEAMLDTKPQRFC